MLIDAMVSRFTDADFEGNQKRWEIKGRNVEERAVVAAK